MGEGNSAFLKVNINAVEDVAAAKAAVAAGIPVAVDGANIATATLAAAVSVGDALGAQKAIGSLTEYVEQLQALGEAQKQAQDFGSKSEQPAEPSEVRKGK